jgi:hypothetical protein
MARDYKYMKKLPLFIAIFPLFACASTIKVTHCTNKELDSTNVKNKTNQISQVKKVLQDFDLDILSINELQYDKINIPTNEYKTSGNNLETLAKLLNQRHLTTSTFDEANTGKNAKTKKDGSYYTQPNTTEARKHADQLNFGTIPGQYSTLM